MRFLTELDHISQDESKVTADVRYRPTGDTYQIEAKYVIGADGGRSLVAEELGFEFEGQGELGYALNAWFEADLSRFVEHRPGVLYFTNHPGREFLFGSGAFLMVQPWNEWVIQLSYDPTVEDLNASDEAVIPRIQYAIGDDSIPIKLKGMNKWQINSLVADSYQMGRAFLAGDAAHRHSPGGGLGSNTSIQDAYNLGWKIAAVVRGEAGPSLLTTYNSERQPIGKSVVERATHIVDISADIPRALGIKAGQTTDEGWAALEGMFEPGERGEARRKGLNEALDHLDNGWNEQGFEMDQRYLKGAVLDDGTPWPTAERDANLYYTPTSHPGSKIPHVWVHARGEQLSTLDIVPAGSWGLITGIGGDVWVEAAKTIGSELGIKLEGRAIGLGLEYDDPEGAWAAVREIHDDGCLLIRPDRHVAWRCHSAAEDAAGSLRTALSSLLGVQ
jgi:2,4-dichlorophenol 6-monooxygenase